MKRMLSCLLGAAFLVGCAVPDSPTKKGESSGDEVEQARKLVLSSAPKLAMSVTAVRNPSVKDGDEVVVEGQIGGSTTPFVEGRASFLLVDLSLTPEDGCDTPWDFCELGKKQLAAARISVKFVDGNGKTIKADARKAFGVKELSKVVVQGKVQRDDKGNVVVLGKGIHVQ